MQLWTHRVVTILLLCITLCSQAYAAINEEELLPVDKAFALTVTAPTRDRIELTWNIADSYYLYRHRIMVAAAPNAPNEKQFKLGTLNLPNGTKHHDEFFGEVETFRDQLHVVQHISADSAIQKITLQVKSQGCADLGICYPPQSQIITVQLPIAPSTALIAKQEGFSRINSISRGTERPTVFNLGRSGANEPLPKEQAFKLNVLAEDGNNLLVRFTPADGYYLYRDKTSFSISGDDGIILGSSQWPEGVIHNDEYFGDVTVYFDSVDVILPLHRTHAEPAHITLTSHFQGCQDGGICYPPMMRTNALTLPSGHISNTPPTASSDDAFDRITDNNAVDMAEDSRLVALLADSNRVWALLLFFGFGLLLAFTPCVLPMIPILSGLIIGQGPNLKIRRAFVLSLTYITANALVLMIAGVVVALIGTNLQIAFQTPWVIIVFSMLFIAFALSSFGFYQLQLPKALHTRMNQFSNKQRSGSLLGVAVMGALSALIVGPCMTPPLAAALLYISQTNDPIFGGMALFTLAMGMGVPLLAFGVAAGRGIPQNGPWLEGTQRVFGLIFLGLAIWMLSRIFPTNITLALWGLLFFGSAALVLSARPQTQKTHFLRYFFALILTVFGILQWFGALSGGRDPLQPLTGLRQGVVAHQEITFQTIKSSADLNAALDAAQKANKPVLFDFYADWCVSCKEMEKYTFSNPAVRAALSDFILLKADVTDNDDIDQELMQRFSIIGPPATLFFRDRQEQRNLRLIGYEKATPFTVRIQQAADVGIQ